MTNKARRTQRARFEYHRKDMVFRALAIGILCLLYLPGYSQVVVPSESPKEPIASAAPEGNPLSAEPVKLYAYNEKDQRTGTVWALPVQGGFVTLRTVLASAARAELVLSGELRARVESVAGEDVEGNLALVFTSEAPASQLEISNSVSLVSEEQGSPASPLHIRCGGETYPLKDRQVRDIPVFGLVYVGKTGHRDPIAGCPLMDEGGAVQAVVVWENPFGHPSAALVPSSRLAKLASEPRISWAAWRETQNNPKTRLRNSLIAEALPDIWRGDYRLAIESLTFLLEQFPEDGRGWYYRGFARAMSGKRALAIVDYENAVAYDPTNAEAHFSLGFSYALMRRRDDARNQVAALAPLDEALAEKLQALLDAISDDDHAEDPPGTEPVPPPQFPKPDPAH